MGTDLIIDAGTGSGDFDVDRDCATLNDVALRHRREVYGNVDVAKKHTVGAECICRAEDASRGFATRNSAAPFAAAAFAAAA
jgi:hypothetical protein